MKSLKNHFSVTLSLFVLLFSLQFYLFLKHIITNYESSISQSYSIVFVSNKTLPQHIVTNQISQAKKIESISSQSIVDKLEESLSKSNLQEFEQKLPKFYKLYLKSLPNDRELESIKSDLIKIDGIYKVEAFSKTYSQIYKLLLIAKNILAIMTILVSIVGYLLILKQITIWKFEHNRRIAVMSLFGAPFWMKSMALYRLVIVDSFIASLGVASVFLLAPRFESVKLFMDQIGLQIPEFSFLLQWVFLFALSFVLSTVAVTVVVLEKNSR